MEINIPIFLYNRYSYKDICENSVLNMAKHNEGYL